MNPRVEIVERVTRFAALTHSLADADLDRPWKWGDYDEGVRFAFFRLYEELRGLSVKLEAARRASNQPTSSAQRILANHQRAYREMQALLLGIDDAQAQIKPAENEWSLWEALVHIVDTEGTFLAINLYALERERTQDGRSMQMSDEAWKAFWAGDPYNDVVEKRRLAGLLDYYQDLHSRVLAEFAGILEDELEIPVVFWESGSMPLRFRLGRFDSHLRQHTIQLEKTLDMLSLPTSEAKRLLRLIYQALAEVEAAALGAGEEINPLVVEVSNRISGYTDEIRPLLPEAL